MGTDPKNVTAAADLLRALLATPDDRPGSWEAEHVEALEAELSGILRLLEATDQGGLT